jgi:hypothetical protein
VWDLPEVMVIRHAISYIEAVGILSTFIGIRRKSDE